MAADDLDFTNLMLGEGVTPVAVEKRADLGVASDKRDVQQLDARRMAAEGEAQEGLSTQHTALVNPFDPLEWKRDGVQDGVYRNLRLGKYQIDARLDLHKKTVARALDELVGFVQECSHFGIRTVLISHGRGQSADAPPNLLRSFLNQWLPQLPEVMAFHSAQKQHGGLAATYVLLRKNEAQRLDNWEKHQKR